MGYSHHWYRPPVIPEAVFRQIRADFEKLILPLADQDVPLAGWQGENEPEIHNDRIRFNGVRQCGHPENEEIFIPYPAAHARGLGPSATAILGPWYDVGVELQHRCCSGQCCHEAFLFPRDVKGGPFDKKPDANGLVLQWTKTAFKPYDIAVTAALLIAKRHLQDQLVIESNGLDAQWADAKELCQQHLGYGAWFGIVEDPRIERWPGLNGTQEEREVRVRLLVEMDPTRFL
jgi:hypothetical protein